MLLPPVLVRGRGSVQSAFEVVGGVVSHDHLVELLSWVVLGLQILIYFCKITSQSDLDPQPGMPQTEANSLLCSSQMPN